MSAMESDAFRGPLAPAVNVTAIVQLVPGAIGAAQVFVNVKSLAFGPVVVALATIRVAAPEFVTATLCDALVVPFT